MTVDTTDTKMVAYSVGSMELKMAAEMAEQLAADKAAWRDD